MLEHRPTVLAVGAGGRYLDSFFLSYHNSLCLSLPLCETFKHILLANCHSKGVGIQVLTTLVTALPLQQWYNSMHTNVESETGRDGLKCCIKDPLNPNKQTTNWR